MNMKDHSIVVCVGDSVSDCGRTRPVGEGNGGLGSSYVQNLHAMLDSAYPMKHLRVINMGVSGDTSRQVRARYEDILALKPDYVTLLIGINDVWRKYDRPDKSAYVPVEEYTENIEWMIRQTMPVTKHMLLLSPFFMNQSREDEVRIMVGQYHDAMRTLAEKYDLCFVDLQKEMDEYFRYNHYMVMSADAVHPNHVGHMIIAKALYRTLTKEEPF